MCTKPCSAVDEARDDVLNDLMAAGRVLRVGYVTGVPAASASDPRHNLTGDPDFTKKQGSECIYACVPCLL